MRDLQTEFDALVKNGVFPFMKALGFRKNTLNFHNQLSDLTQVFNIQKSQWNSKDSISFVFNIGFFNLDIYRAMHDNQLAPKVPKGYDCFIGFRLGQITHNHDYWYELNNSINLDVLQNQIRSHIESYVIPLFNKFISIDSLRELYKQYDFVEIQMDNLSKFMWFIKLGENELANKLLRETYSKALVPKENVSTINYPDGRTERKVSKPTVNHQYIDRIKGIATKYKIEL